MLLQKCGIEQVFLKTMQKNCLLLIKRYDLIYMEYKEDYLVYLLALQKKTKNIFIHNLFELNEELLSI